MEVTCRYHINHCFTVLKFPFLLFFGIISQLKSCVRLKTAATLHLIQSKKEKKKRKLVLSSSRAVYEIWFSCRTYTDVSHCSVAFREIQELIILNGAPEDKRVKLDQW